MKQDFRSGFTPVELMVAVAILGVLVALGSVAYGKWQQKEQFREVQRNITSSLNQARSVARRTSQDQKISWGSGKITVINVSDKDINLFYGASLEVISPTNFTEFSYLAPFGRKSISDTIIMLLESKRGSFAKIYIYGSSGKVALTSCKEGNTNTC